MLMRCRGYSLIELMVSVAVIAVLIAIAAATLRPAREAATDSMTLSVLRGESSLFSAWSNDHREQWLHADTLRRPHVAHFYSTTGLYQGSLDHLGVRKGWPLVLAAWRGAAPQAGSARIAYSITLVVDRTAFGCDALRDGVHERHFRSVGVPNVPYPSQKVALYQDPKPIDPYSSRSVERQIELLRLRAALADGSVRALTTRETRPSAQASCGGAGSDWLLRVPLIGRLKASRAETSSPIDGGDR